VRTCRPRPGRPGPDITASIPVAGITITDLADRLGMTKQASGQFVTTLAADGYLDVRADPDDRRARLVFLTTQGVRTLRAVNARIARIEREWARVVGAEGLFAAGADAGGISTGGYASGLAAALVFGRIAAESALESL